MNILEARRRTLGGRTIKRTAAGNPAIATDSLARMYPGIEMQGWTEQDGTPTPEAPVPIVSAGTKNQETGKWEYEITITNAQTDPDKNQTVTLTADRPLTKWDRLEKRGGQWGWVYGSAEVDMSSEVTWVIHPGYEQETSNLFRGVISWVYKIDPTDAILCNILPYYQAALADVNGIYPLGNNLFARIVGIKSLEDFQEKIQGGKVLAKLSTETFVPLTTAEQEAMNALHTYRPTTVLSNQQGCQMALTYKTRKGVGGGGNLLDFENITFVRCYPVSQYSIMCNIENSYMSSIDIYYLNDLISESKGKKLVFSFTGNPSGRLASIVLHGTYSDGSAVKEANNYGDNPVELIIPDTLEPESVSRLEVRVNRNTIPFTDTTTIISNLNLRLED